MNYLKLIRWKNLVMMALIAVIIRYAIVLPIISYSVPFMVMDSNFSNLDFILLIISCLSIAASGNVINDYYDTKTDNINKPEKVLIPKKISHKKAMRLHHILNGIGIASGLYLSFKLGNLSMAFMFVIPAILLRIYSTNFSRMLILGNIIVSFLAGLLIITLGAFETFAFHSKWFPVLFSTQRMSFEDSPTMTIFNWLFALGFFSFLTTWIRELAKDVADIEGDRFVGAQTIPIKLGIKASKGLIIGLATIGLTAVLYINYLLSDSIQVKLLFEYSSLVVGLFVGVIYLTIKAEEKESFQLISKLCKVLMIVGVIYPLINHLIKYVF